MTVGAPIVDASHTAQAAGFEAGGELALQRSVRAPRQLGLAVNAIGRGLARDDVHHAAHGIGAIDQPGRSAQHFYLLGHLGLIGVGDGMTVKSGVLGQSVNEHQHLRHAAHSAHLHGAGCSGRNAVAQQAARGDKQARHLLTKGGKHRRTKVGRQLFARHDAHRHGLMALVGGHAAARHHSLVQDDGIGLGTHRQPCRQQEEEE